MKKEKGQGTDGRREQYPDTVVRKGFSEEATILAKPEQRQGEKHGGRALSWRNSRKTRGGPRTGPSPSRWHLDQAGNRSAPALSRGHLPGLKPPVIRRSVL